MANTWILFSYKSHLMYKTEEQSAKTQCRNIKGTLHYSVLIGYTCAFEISSLHWFKYNQVCISVFTNLLPSYALWSMLMWRFLPHWCLPLSFGRWKTPAVQLQWYCSGVARVCFCLYAELPEKHLTWTSQSWKTLSSHQEELRGFVIS